MSVQHDNASAGPLDGVIVLGVDSQIGLAVVRDLGRSGVPVFGIGRSSAAVGLHSRYLRRGYVHGPRDDELLALMNRIAVEDGARFVITVSEGDILFLNRHRAELPSLDLLIPSEEAMRTVIDKARVYAQAAALGLATPRSFYVAPDGTVPEPLEAADFPVVLKWAEPANIQPRLRAHGLPFHKAEYCHDAGELQGALQRYRPLGRYPLVQGYCPGHGLGQMVYLHQGQPVLRFQHRRLHEWPPEGGYSTLCESLPPEENASLMNRSVRLLQAIGWEGPAMVEYRFDPATGRAVLMEINGRFWGSLPLAYHAGARFPWLLYNLMGRGQSVEDFDRYRTGVRCKFLLPDLKRLLRILFQPERIQDRTLKFNRTIELLGFAASLLDPRTRYYVLTLTDPKPFLSELGFLMKRRR